MRSDAFCSELCFAFGFMEGDGMTLNGAIMQLVELSEHPRMPVIFKPLIQKVIETISELEENPEPHWIPVTERLPETSDAVLTTYIVNGDRSGRYVEESSYYWTDESWCSPWDEYRMPGTSIEVIAWMPMPAPWKGEVTE